MLSSLTSQDRALEFVGGIPKKTSPEVCGSPQMCVPDLPPAMTKRTSDPGLEVTSLETHYLAFTTWDYPDAVWTVATPSPGPQDLQD